MSDRIKWFGYMRGDGDADGDIVCSVCVSKWSERDRSDPNLFLLSKGVTKDDRHCYMCLRPCGDPRRAVQAEKTHRHVQPNPNWLDKTRTVACR